MPLINAGLTYECGFIRKFGIVFFRCILNSYFPAPHSYVNPALIRSIFKGFVRRAKKLCSEKYLDDELNFLVHLFVENEHD